MSQTIDEFFQAGQKQKSGVLFGIKGVPFTPGEDGYPLMVAPGFRPSIGTQSGLLKLGTPDPATGRTYTSYWLNLDQSLSRNERNIYESVNSLLHYTNPINTNDSDGISGTGKFYGMSDQQLAQLGKNPNKKGSIVLSALQEFEGDTKLTAAFHDYSVAGTGLNAIQTTTAVKPQVVIPTPDTIKFVPGSITFKGEKLSAETLQVDERLHEYMQSIARGMRDIGVADENLPIGAKELLDAPSTAEYENVLKQYLINHPNEVKRKTAEQVKDLKLLSRFGEKIDEKSLLKANPPRLLAYQLSEHGSRKYAFKDEVDKLLPSSNRTIPGSIASVSTSVPTTPKNVVSSTMEKAEQKIAAKVASNEIPKTIEEGVSVAVRRSGATESLLKAASHASSAVAAGTSNSAALRGAGAALSILRGVI